MRDPELLYIPDAKEMLQSLELKLEKNSLPWWKRETPWRIEDRLYEPTF